MIVIVAAAGIEGPSFSSLESNLFLGLMGASRLEWKPCEWFEEYCGFSAAQYRAGTLLPRLLFLLAPRWSSFFHREKMIPATLTHADEIENWLAHPEMPRLDSSLSLRSHRAKSHHKIYEIFGWKQTCFAWIGTKVIHKKLLAAFQN